jgi:hypothetical protein
MDVIDEAGRLSSLRCNLTVRAWREYGRLTRRLVEDFFFFEVVITVLRSVCMYVLTPSLHMQSQSTGRRLNTPAFT